VLPQGIAACLDLRQYPRPAIFDWLQQAGRIEREEMLRTFNCGIGMTICVPGAEADRAIEVLQRAGEQPQRVGELRRGEREIVIEG
jgi:phosphoribosylformylglycinamidine cyclo-ligase